MCHPTGYGFWAFLVWNRVWFSRKLSTGVDEHICRLNFKGTKKGIEICELEVVFKKPFFLAL